MRLSVSNIAWTHGERLAAYEILQQAGITGLEIAPGVLFADQADAFAPPDGAVRRALDEVAAAGLTLTSMQALLYGVTGAALFGAPEERARFDHAMRRAIGLAGRLGIPNLVFGAPRQRVVPPGMAMEDALAQAAVQFRGLGDAALALGTAIVIEANPAEYGTNFLTRLDQVQAFVGLVDHPAIGIILDTGALAMTHETAELAALAPRLRHVHISEPHLAPAPAQTAPAQTGPARALVAGLAAVGYAGAVSIEMKRAEDGLASLSAAVQRLLLAYGQAGLGA